MNTLPLNIPIAFIIFNRLDTTKEVFEVIRKVAPTKLYIIADAPREGNKLDEAKVREVREYVERNIDWDCEIFKNYASSNMGSQQRVTTGLNWVFGNEEYAIILEDDVVPVLDFFQYCQELLVKYREDANVMMISGTNLLEESSIEDSYTFSCFSSIWGWATWRRAWDKMDVDMKNWPEDRKNKKIRYVANPLSYLWIHWNLEYTYRKEIDAWDFPWGYARFRNYGVGIVPKENLVKNIGIGHPDATNMKEVKKEISICGKVEFPLQHPDKIKRDVVYDKKYIRKYYNPYRAWIEWNRKALFYVIKKVKKVFYRNCDNREKII